MRSGKSWWRNLKLLNIDVLLILTDTLHAYPCWVLLFNALSEVTSASYPIVAFLLRLIFPWGEISFSRSHSCMNASLRYFYEENRVYLVRFKSFENQKERSFTFVKMSSF